VLYGQPRQRVKVYLDTNTTFQGGGWKILMLFTRWYDVFFKIYGGLSPTNICFFFLFPALFLPQVLCQLLQNFKATPSIFFSFLIWFLYFSLLFFYFKINYKIINIFLISLPLKFLNI
jgi:hypothetical protein